MPRSAFATPSAPHRFRIPSRVATSFPDNDVIPFIYYSPEPTRSPAPAIVVLHGLGLSKDVFTPVGPPLQRQGFAALLLDLPFHGDRVVTETERLFPFRGDIDQYVLGVRQMVADVRTCLHWLRHRREIDGSRLAVVGFSFGGILCSLLMGLGLDLAAGVALMAAGDWSDLIFHSPLTADIRTDLERRGVSHAQAAQAFDGLSASTHAAGVRDLLIVAGRRDQNVPPRLVDSFWRRLDPSANRIVWMNSGHVPPVRTTAREVLRFLREKLRPTIGNGKDHSSGHAGPHNPRHVDAGFSIPLVCQLPVPF